MAEGKPRTISSTQFVQTYGAVMHEVINERRAVIVASHGRPQVARTRLARLTAGIPGEGKEQ
jgi:hypothetical protein